MRRRWAVIAADAAIGGIRERIDTGVIAGGQFCATIEFALTERAQFVAVFAIRAVNAAAGVGVGNACVGREMIVVGARSDLTFAIHAVAC